MECQPIKGIQRPQAAHRSLALPSGHPDFLVTETHKGSTKGSMHRESALVSSTLIIPEATPFLLKSSRSFYSQPSWVDSGAWPFEEPVAYPATSLSSTPNVSHSHLPVAPSSVQPNSYSSSATSGASELTTTHSSWISSLTSKESTLPDPGGMLREKKEKKGKGKKTKLGKMYKRASRLFSRAPSSSGVAKRSSLKAPLPLMAPPEEDPVVDPFASGKFVDSYGLSPIEPSLSASHQRTGSRAEVKSTESQFLRPPSIPSPLGTSDSPSLRESNQVLEGQSIRGRDLPFPLNVGDSNSTSLSPRIQRIRSNSVSTTLIAKPFHTDNPPPMPHMPSVITAERPSLPDDLLKQLLPSPLPVSPPKSVTRPRANSLSEMGFRTTVQPTKAVLMKDDASSSSINHGLQPLPVIPMRTDQALAVQTQAQLSDADPTIGTRRRSVASSLSMSSLKGKYLQSSLDPSTGQRRPAGNIARDMGPAQELQAHSNPESLSGSLPPVVASGMSERICRRRGSGSTSSEDTSPAPYQQHQSVTKPILPPLSTRNLSPSANSSDSETLVNGSPRSQQCLFPRSPSLPDLRPRFAGAPPTPKLKLIPHSEIRELSEKVHVRSPSLPTFPDASLPQALPASIVDRLKLRGRNLPRLTRRMSSTGSVSSNEPTSIITEKSIASGPNPLTHTSDHSQPVRRDARFRKLSHASVRPSAMHERNSSTSEILSPTFRFGHTHTPVRPSLSSIQASASKIQSFPSHTTSLLLQTRRGLKTPSVPDLRARVIPSSSASGCSRSQPSSPPIPGQIRHVQSHSHSIPVPPIPPIPDNYKPRASTNAKSETAPPLNVNFCRPRPNLTRPKEISYPQTKKAEKLFHERFDEEELVNERGMDFMDDAPSKPSSRRMSQKVRSLSTKGQGGGDIPPVPPLPSSPPMLALPASRIPSRDRMIIGAAL